jgi:hypothetical protein
MSVVTGLLPYKTVADNTPAKNIPQHWLCTSSVPPTCLAASSSASRPAMRSSLPLALSLMRSHSDLRLDTSTWQRQERMRG